MGCGSSTVEEHPTKENNGTTKKTGDKHSQTKPQEAKTGNTADNKSKPTKPVEAKPTQQNKKDVSAKSAPKEKLNFDDFKDIDQHARSVPSSKESTVESLAEYLVSPAKNDVEKVRAFYVWVCDNISYDTDAFFGWTTDSIDHSEEGVLKSRTSDYEGYSRLLLALCEAVGIPCKKLSGYSKGYCCETSDDISFDERTNHAWNVVQLGGKWKFIESTWGAGYVDIENTEFIKAYTDFYFLTPPQDFIYDHFPYISNNLEESNKWQLLDNPVSIETYSEMIKPSTEAKQLGVKFSHTNSLVKIEKSCKMTVTATDVPFDNFFHDVYDSNGVYMFRDEAVMVLLEANRETTVTIRPPDTARYTLKLRATLGGKSTTLVDYDIDCDSVEADYPSYPTNREYYGPKPDFVDRGFEQSGVSAYHVCKNGEFELTLKTSTTPEVLVYLKDASDEDWEKYTMIEQNNESVTIKARLINKGFYKLTLLSKHEEERYYNEVYTFLIKNKEPAESKAMYPTNREYYGPKPDFVDRGFEQSGVSAYHVCKNGEFELTLKTSTTPEVLVYLKDASDEDCKKYTMIEQNNESVTIKARLINKGSYKLTLLSKHEEETYYNEVYTFLIKNEEPAESKAMYPHTYITTRTYQCKLIRPLVRDLAANSEVTIEFICPFFDEVLANKQIYRKGNGDHWTITTTTGESGDISVSGQLPNENLFRTVYAFDIKS